jgi:transcriptional regulator with XRE-family HTH domain
MYSTLFLRDTFPNPAFGKNVRRYRMQAGLTQEKLGELSDLDRGYISGVERGIRNPTVVSIEKIADALHIHAGKLFEYTIVHGEWVEHTATADAHSATH